MTRLITKLTIELSPRDARDLAAYTEHKDGSASRGHLQSQAGDFVAQRLDQLRRVNAIPGEGFQR